MELKILEETVLRLRAAAEERIEVDATLSRVLEQPGLG